MRRLGACGIGHVLGSCIVPAYASDNTGPEFIVSVAAFIVCVASAAFSYKQVEEAKRSADEAKRSADEAKRSADQEFKASAEGKIQAAVAEVMKPFEWWGRKEMKVIPRPVIGTIKDRIKSWDKHATVIHGQLDSGRTWAVYEALRGVRGVVRFKIEKAEWEMEMCKQLRVDDTGMFKEVMRGVLKKLKNFPDNLTKYPILLLDIPCATTEGLT